MTKTERELLEKLAWAILYTVPTQDRSDILNLLRKLEYEQDSVAG